MITVRMDYEAKKIIKYCFGDVIEPGSITPQE
jgi:hypothetical protein